MTLVVSSGVNSASTLRAASLCALLLFSAACNNEESETIIRGGERLAFAQQASSLQEARSLSFRIYVDNVGSLLGGTQCSDGGGGAYECSGILPSMSSGRHILQLTAVLGGQESGRSAPLTVTVESTGSSGGGGGGRDGGGSGGGGGGGGGGTDVPRGMNAPTLVTACLSSGSSCYDVRVIASGLGDAAAMTSLPDGRLAFIEGERQVRIIASRALLPEPALAMDASQARIVGLVADPNFIATRTMFVSWIERRASGESVLNVTRYREVQNELGEGATIVTGIPVPERAVVPLAADSAGRLYVAVPASASGGAGHVERFGFDGSLPRDSFPFSPVFAEGYAWPTGLAVTPGANQLWLGGNSSGESEALSSISLQTNTASQWPLRRRAVQQGQFADLSFVSFTRPAAAAASSRQNPVGSTVLVGADRGLFVGLVSAAGVASGFDQVRFDPDVRVQAAASASDGSIQVVVARDSTGRGAPVVSILELRAERTLRMPAR